MRAMEMQDWTLERAVFGTVRYFDIFALPVTAVQVWRSLLVGATESEVRWGGHLVPRLSEVEQVLRRSLSGKIDSKWGYYFLRGGRAKVRQRLARHVLAQHKWNILQRAGRVLARLPLVRMIGVTGSLALSNTQAHSDLDLLVVVKKGRIWTARLMLLLATQLMGRRRKYWDRQAPDMVCLNHYVTDDALAVAPAIRSVYTAMLYGQVVPLAGLNNFGRWRRANETWLKSWLMYPEAPELSPRQYVRVGRIARGVRRAVESVLLEPVGEVIERWAEKLQRRTIAQHTNPGRAGRIMLSDTELAFHPDSKEPAVLHKFAQDPGQGTLL